MRRIIRRPVIRRPPIEILSPRESQVSRRIGSPKPEPINIRSLLPSGIHLKGEEPLTTVRPIISSRQPIIEDVKENIIELEHLVYSYPDIKNSDLQGIIGRKLEFAGLASDGREPTPERGEFFSSQTFIHRFMEIYDEILVAHPTGSGKTGTAAGSAERFKRHFFKGVLTEAEQYLSGQRNHITHVYILVPGPVIKEEFRNQIINKFSQPGDYDTEYIREAKNEATAQRRITKLLGTFYSIMTYGAFAKEIHDLTPSLDREVISDRYSGSMFIIDEGHNFISPDQGMENFWEEIEVAQALFTIPEEDEEEEEEKERESGKKGKKSGGKTTFKDKDLIYETIFKVFKFTRRRKVMILAATPMINSPQDLTYIMNLLIPEGEPLMNPKEDLVKMSDEKLHSFLHGRVSYVPDLDTSVDVVYEGAPLSDFLPEDDPGILFKGKYHSYRSTVYMTLMEYNQDRRGPPYQGNSYEWARLTSSKWRWDQRQAANFGFPDGSYGSPGFSKYIVKDRKTYRLRQKTDLKEWLKIDNLVFRSSKYAPAIELMKQNKGKVFAYSDFLKGSGIIVYGLALQENGFEKFDRSENMFLSNPRELGVKDSNGKRIERRVGIEKKLRYAMLTGEMNSKERNAILSLFNSWENRHGDYIKVILTSPVAQFGLNVTDVTMIMLFEAGWHQAGRHQASSRPLRAVSHVFLLEEERERLYDELYPDFLREGYDEEDADILAWDKAVEEARIEVKIYQMAAGSPKSGHSVDLILYKQSEEKAISIDYIFNKLKSSSVDCLVHRYRKERKGSTNRIEYFGSKYSCLTDVTEPIDTSSYDVLYSEPNVQEAIEFLKDVFSRNSSYKSTDLYRMFRELGESKEKNPNLPDYTEYYYRPKFVIMAAERLISSKTPIIDRFGFTTYLVENNGYLFLTKTYPLSNTTEKRSLLSTYYVENLIGGFQRNLEEYLNIIQRSSQGSVIEEIKSMTPAPQNKEQILSLINSLSNNNQVELLEWAVLNEDQPVAKVILQRYFINLYSYVDPQPLVEKAKSKVENTTTDGRRRRGRPRKAGSEPTVPLNNEDFEKLAEADEAMVYYNNLSDTEQDIFIEDAPFGRNMPGFSRLSKEGQDAVLYYMKLSDRERDEFLRQAPKAGYKVYFHNLTDQDKDETAYKTTPKFMTGRGHIRIYRTQEGVWRELTIWEKPVYNNLAEFIQKGFKLKDLQQYDIYGVVLEDRQFRVRSQIGYDPSKKGDKRHDRKGKVATSYKVSELIYFLYHEGAQPPIDINLEDVSLDMAIDTLEDEDFGNSGTTRNKLDDFLDEGDEEAIFTIYSWYRYLEELETKNRRNKKRPLADELEKVLRESGKFYDSHQTV